MEKEDLSRIWQEFKTLKTQESKQKLIEHYFSYVQHIASNMSKKFNYKISSSELASYGVDGLYQALDTYDKRKAVKFETFAYRRIAGSMIDVLRQEDWIPRSVRQRQAKIEAARMSLSHIKGEDVGIDYTLTYLNIDREEYHSNMKKYNALGSVSIEECKNMDESSDNKAHDFYKNTIDKKAISPDSEMERQDFLIKVLKENFNEIEFKVIYQYYFRKLTMKEISEYLNTTQSKVSRIHKKVIKKLKMLVTTGKLNLDLLLIK